MAAGATIKHKRKAGAFVNGDLVAGEWGLDTTNSVWYYSINGTTVVALSTGGVTNSAGANVLTKSNGTNLVASRITDDATTITATSAQIEMGVSTGGSYRTRIKLDNSVGKVSIGDIDFWAQGTALIVDDGAMRVQLGDVDDLGQGISFINDDDNELVAFGDIKQYQNPIYTEPAKSGMQFLLDNSNEVIKYGQLTAKYGGGIVKLDSYNKLFTVSFIETPPSTHIVAATGAAGTNNLTSGVYNWLCTFVTDGGETLRGSSISNQITVNSATQLPPQLSSIPLGSANCIARKIYRTESGAVSAFKYVATIADNITTTYTDNLADASLGAVAPTSNTAIDERLSVDPFSNFVNSVTAGTNVTVDNTDPANPIVSATGGSGVTQAEAIAYAVALG